MPKEFLSHPMIYRANKTMMSHGIPYKFNNYGFRCDDFDNWQNHKYRIIFVGGSVTEGMGLHLEHCWAKILHQKICDELNYNIPYWNLAVAGASTDHVARYLYTTGGMLQPHIIISWLPPIERRELYNSDFWAPALSDNKGLTKVLIDKRYIDYQTEKNFAFINSMLEQWNSHFIYKAFCENDEDAVDFGFARMVNIKGLPEIKIEGDFAADMAHAGPKTNRAIAENMFENFCPIIKLKLNI